TVKPGSRTPVAEMAIRRPLPAVFAGGASPDARPACRTCGAPAWWSVLAACPAYGKQAERSTEQPCRGRERHRSDIHATAGVVDRALKPGLPAQLAPVAGQGERCGSVQPCQEIRHGVGARFKGLVLHAAKQEKIAAAKNIV